MGADTFASLRVVTNPLSVSTPTAGAGQPEENRLLEHAAWILDRLDRLDSDARTRLEQMLEIDPAEATACLEGQARAVARAILTSDEALTIYQALTPEGWEPGTRLELKMTIVSLMDRLLRPLCCATSSWRATGTPSVG